MRKIRQPREIGEGRQLRAEMVLRGVQVKDVARELGWGKDTLYRVLKDQRTLTEVERVRLLEVIEELAA